jgi:hypothetical protein
VLEFQQFANLERDRCVPPSYRDQRVLFRPWSGFPRWDFVSNDCFIQVSLSPFGDHNVGTAKLDLSFVDSADHKSPTNNLALRYITGSADYSSKIENGVMIVTKSGKVVPFKFIYITYDAPKHPQIYKQYTNLRVISFKDLWGKGFS